MRIIYYWMWTFGFISSLWSMERINSTPDIVSNVDSKKTVRLSMKKANTEHSTDRLKDDLTCKVGDQMDLTLMIYTPDNSYPATNVAWTFSTDGTQIRRVQEFGFDTHSSQYVSPIDTTNQTNPTLFKVFGTIGSISIDDVPISVVGIDPQDGQLVSTNDTMPTYYDAFTYNCTPEVFNGEIIKSVDSEGDTIYFFQSNLRAVSDIQSNVSGYFGTIHLINTYRGYQYRNSTGTQWIFDTQNTYVLDIPEDSTSALMKVVNWNLSDPDPDYTFTDNTRQLLKDDAKRYTIRDNFRTFFMFNKNNEVGNIWYPCGTTGSGVNPNPFNYLDWGYNATIDWTDNAWVISSFNPHCSFGNAGIPPSWVRNIRDCHNPSVSPEYNIR